MSRRTHRRRWLDALLLLGGLSLATLFVTAVPHNAEAEKGFEIDGAVGTPVELGYATGTVTNVRIADTVTPDPPILDTASEADGIYLVIDVEWTAHETHRQLSGVELVDTRGRTHIATSPMGIDCVSGMGVDPAFPIRATHCFDVPRDALPNARLRLGRGQEGSGGTGQYRDSVAVIDLGLDEKSITGLTQDTPAAVTQGGPVSFEGDNRR